MESIKEKRIITGITDAHVKSQDLARPILFSFTFRFDTRDILPLITHPSDNNTTRIYWAQPSRGFSYAGLGVALNFESMYINQTNKIYDTILENMQEGISIGENSLIGPRTLGGFSFNQYIGKDKTWKSFPRIKFLLPECLATLTDDGAWLTISKLVHPDYKKNELVNEFKKTILYYKNRLPVTLPPISMVEINKYKDVPKKEEYTKTIFSVLSKIKPGEIEKVVISRSRHLRIGNQFHMASAMQVLRNAYPNCISFGYALPNKGIFFGSTPERLVSLKNDFFETEALAGTIGRGKNMEEDRVLAESLIKSHKEREEHRLVREQILRKINPFVTNIKYSKIPQIMKLKNVQHLHTYISGKLICNKTALDLVKLLHPTSAVAGTPTLESMKVIEDIETHDRGWYSGPIGWLDKKGDGEFYVALRSALVRYGEAHVFAGGGIVSESHPDKEWIETKLKLEPIISALSGGQI